MTKNGPKTGFLSLLKKLVINFYWICSSTDPIFGKSFVPEIWAKILSASQIAGFFNQPYLQNKSVKQPEFLHVDTNSHKLKNDQKIIGWAWSKMGLASLVMGL